jgi:hypothetical protein
MPDPTAPDVDAALARLSEVANRIADERNIFLAALRSVRVYVQDCIENGHDRTMLGKRFERKAAAGLAEQAVEQLQEMDVAIQMTVWSLERIFDSTGPSDWLEDTLNGLLIEAARFEASRRSDIENGGTWFNFVALDLSEVQELLKKVRT